MVWCNKKYFLLVFIFLQAAALFGQTVIDKKGSLLVIDSSKWQLSGNNVFYKKTGNVGIGNTAPLYKLDVTGKIRLTDSLVGSSVRLGAVAAGTATDSIVTINTVTGDIRRINAGTFNRNDSTTASNGLSLSGKDIRLGGNLSQSTTVNQNSQTLTIATGGAAFSITALPSGTVTDSLLSLNNVTGQVRKIPNTYNPAVIQLVDAAGTQALTTSFSDIVFGTTSVADAGYVAGSGGAQVTVASSGLYNITYRITANVTNNTASGGEFQLLRNGTAVTGSLGYTFHSNANRLQGTVTVVLLVQLAANDIIKVQGRRYTAAGNLSLTANGSSLLIQKLR